MTAPSQVLGHPIGVIPSAARPEPVGREAIPAEYSPEATADGELVAGAEASGVALERPSTNTAPATSPATAAIPTHFQRLMIAFLPIYVVD